MNNLFVDGRELTIECDIRKFAACEILDLKYLLSFFFHMTDVNAVNTLLLSPFIVSPLGPLSDRFLQLKV